MRYLYRYSDIVHTECYLGFIIRIHKIDCSNFEYEYAIHQGKQIYKDKTSRGSIEYSIIYAKDDIHYMLNKAWIRGRGQTHWWPKLQLKQLRDKKKKKKLFIRGSWWYKFCIRNNLFYCKKTGV